MAAVVGTWDEMDTVVVEVVVKDRSDAVFVMGMVAAVVMGMVAVVVMGMVAEAAT